jgi:hypothetical protein
MTEPIQYDFEFVVRAKSAWLAPFAKAMAALFYCLAVFGASALQLLAAICLILPDWKLGAEFLGGYQSGMNSVTHFAVMAIASSLVSGLYRNKDRLRIRAVNSTGETAAAGGAAKRAPKAYAAREI